MAEQWIFLNLKILKELPIAFPPIEEQVKIVEVAGELFTYADKLESQITEARKRIDKLTQSILAKAFRGELVPQNPDDEPAEQLLARIQAQREAEAAAKKPTRKKTTRRKQVVAG